ncbi:MAG: hypothetical protein GXO75_08795 [Calditrichaeota bacterium]|nr:hypothetical protein [Calditrichota bacterium]
MRKISIIIPTLNEAENVQHILKHVSTLDSNLKLIQEQLEIFWPLTCLRGISWCAMAYIEYRQSDRPLKNLFAFKKIEMYLEEDFIQQVFKQII